VQFGKNVKTSSREDEKLLGEQVEGAKTIIVFVDTEVPADNQFELFLCHGYPSLFHGRWQSAGASGFSTQNFRERTDRTF
jgi:hypothetical protein